MKKILVLFIIIIISTKLGAQNDFCGTRNKSFQQGEVLTFTVFYSVAGIYVNAGNAVFTTTLEKLGNKPVYHVTGTGNSNSRYDWIFKVRDKYESFFDTNFLQPLKFIRSVNEGGYKKNENITFNQNTNTAITSAGVFKIPNCVQDVLSAVYNARNVDFNKYKSSDKIPFTMFIDNEVNHLYIRYLGKETIKTRYGKFRCIKFRPLLVAGTMFSGGEKMTVWVTDDENHIPVRVESPIIVGSVKVDLMQYRNTRYPMSSLINFR
ncbi:MAG: DUF3108 domain-containing protein [Chitinophagaceae bacterium]